MAQNWTINIYIGSTNANESHLDYINEGQIQVPEDYVLSGFKGTIDLNLTVQDTKNQSAWKAANTVEIVLMSAPNTYPRLSKYQEKRVVSEKITTRNTSNGGGSCTLSAENALVLVGGNNLYIGAVGYDSTGNVVRTTNMQYACPIEQGASVEELTGGAQMSLTAMEALLQRVNTAVESVEQKMDTAGYDPETDFANIPVVSAAGNLKVRPVEFAIDDSDNFVLRGTTTQVIATIPRSDIGGIPASGYDGTAGKDLGKIPVVARDGAVYWYNPMFSFETSGGVRWLRLRAPQLDQNIANVKIADLQKELGLTNEEVSSGIWSGYKFMDGRAVIKATVSVSNKALSSQSGVYATSTLYTSSTSKMPENLFVEKPEVRATFIPTSSDNHISAYPTFKVGDSNNTLNSYYIYPPLVQLVCNDHTSNSINGELRLVAEGRWK